MKEAPPASDGEAIHEPNADWVPLDSAPYYCYREGLVTSPDAWKLAVQAEVERAVKEARFKSSEQWLFEESYSTSTACSIQIRSGGVLTTVWPGGIYVRPVGHRRWTVMCSGPDLWSWPPGKKKAPDWDRLTEEACGTTEAEFESAHRHRKILELLSCSWHFNFLSGVQSGSVRIMARKNTVLTPFDRVTWDQWHFFRLDDWPEMPPQNWFDPREFSMDCPSLCTATGPMGERLFAIYVAPGTIPIGNDLLQQKCRLWFCKLLRDYPDRAPKAKEKIICEAAQAFPDLSKKIIKNIMVMTLLESRRESWFRGGRPPSKPPRKSPQKK